MFEYESLTHYPSAFRSLTGMTAAEFDSLLTAFRTAWPAFAYSIDDDREARRTYAFVLTYLVALASWAALGLGLLAPWLVQLLAPHAPYTVSDALFVTTAGLAKSEGLPLATHVAEAEAEDLLVHDGVGPFAAGLRTRGFAAAFTQAAPQAKDGPTDIFFARIGPRHH